MTTDLDSFAAEYFAASGALGHRASRDERIASLTGPPNASDRLDDLIFDNPGEAWQFILALVERAPDEEALSGVAAGPIEDLISRHGGSFCDRIIDEARANARFKTALNYTSGWDSLPNEVRLRLIPLLDSDVRAHWEVARRSGKKRWRPPQARPKAERFK
jgi:hypothetical protein